MKDGIREYHLDLIESLSMALRSHWEDQPCDNRLTEAALFEAERLIKATKERGRTEGSGPPLIARALLAAYWRDPKNGRLFLDAIDSLELLCKGMNSQEAEKATKTDA